MTKMRDNMPTILILLVVAFILTIVFEWGMDYLGLRSRGHDYVGVINDRKISYQEFIELVRQRSEQEKQQTGKEPDENALNRIRDEVWNSLVTQTLVDEEIKRLGIEVPDQEIVDWVKGDNPPEFLYKQFVDSNGVFNRAAYEAAIADPRNKEIWIQIEQGLKKQRMQEKLQSLILASVRVSESELFEKYVEQNLKLNMEYVFFDPNKYVTDEEVNLTDSDIEKYYNEHSAEFKTEPTRKLKYVKFKEVPSAKDTQSVISELEDVLDKVRSGADFMDLLNTYSETPTTEIFYKHGELSPTKEEKLFSAKVGDIVGPFSDFDGYHLVKILEERTGNDEFIRASHILINIQGNDSTSALNQAKEIIVKLKKGEDFATLAKQFSKDPGSAEKGGDLGWFGKGRMVKPFEDACYKAQLNQIVGPVKTQFGYHIIKVTGKSKREIKIADIVIPVKISSETRSLIYQNAQDFRYLAQENGFIKEAESVKYQILETPAFTKDGIIPGIGKHPALNRFAFEKDLGDISEVFPIPEGYGVFMISEIKKGGIRPLSDLKESLKPRVLREKKMQILAKKVMEIRKEISDADPLQKITEKHPDITVQTTGQFALISSIPGIGRDIKLIGALNTLLPFTVSKPIEGTRGYYIVKILDKSGIDSTAYNAQKDMFKKQILQTKKSQFISEWLEQLKKNADIEDNRDMFFR